MSGARSFKIPQKWSRTVPIGTLFPNNLIACKTPLNNCYHVPRSKLWTPQSLIDAKSLEGKKLGMVVDLTNTDRYYDGNDEFENKGIIYKKYMLGGNGIKLSKDVIEQITAEIHSFLTTNPERVCAVHCTHGLNRTGLIICSYLIQYEGMSLTDAFNLFKQCRPDGIYRLSIATQLEQLFEQTLDEDIKSCLQPV